MKKRQSNYTSNFHEPNNSLKFLFKKIEGPKNSPNYLHFRILRTQNSPMYLHQKNAGTRQFANVFTMQIFRDLKIRHTFDMNFLKPGS